MLRSCAWITASKEPVVRSQKNTLPPMPAAIASSPTTWNGYCGDSYQDMVITCKLTETLLVPLFHRLPTCLLLVPLLA